MRPHDLLRLKDGAQLTQAALPEWAIRSLRQTPFVVVRRDAANDDLIPVGIRGVTRDQRHAAFVHADDIESIITPESLAIARSWKSPRCREHAAFVALDRIAAAASDIDLIWGPGGAVGFELATGTHALTASSDVDIVVYPDERHTRDALTSFRDAVSDANIRVDILIEATLGAAALDEWIASTQRVLIKTCDGPRLGEFSW
jgi:phosphoribosyl-dephospho-CoA transferase